MRENCIRLMSSWTAKTRRAAILRYAAVNAVEAHELLGSTRTAAIVTVAAEYNVSTRAIWRWCGLISGISRDPVLRLRFLAWPRTASNAR